MGGTTQVTVTAGLWCRRCHLPALVPGDPEWGIAVHAGTGEEQGLDGHLCAPVDFETAGMRAGGRVTAAALGFP
jgi:hypothetical protein